MLGEQSQHEALGSLECLLLALFGDEIKLGHAHHNVLDFKRPARIISVSLKTILLMIMIMIIVLNCKVGSGCTLEHDRLGQEDARRIIIHRVLHVDVGSHHQYCRVGLYGGAC